MIKGENMKKNGKDGGCHNGKRHPKQRGLLVRSICMLLGLTLFLFACVGCTSYASSEETATLSAELAEANKELGSLKEGYDAAIQKIDTLKTDGEKRQAEIDALQSEKEAAQKEIEALKGSNQAAQEEIEALKESNQAAQEEIEALKGNHTAMQQEIDSLKEDHESALQEIETLKEQIQELQKAPAPDDTVQKIKIYIDQGHNPTSYHNAGASGNRLYEQDVTFEIGILLAALLEADGHFEVCLSRPTAETVLGSDNDSSLDARVKGAKDFGADYFISLHVNAFTADTAHGIEVYAANQDSVSYDFGSALLEGLVSSTNLRNRGMKVDPALRVLRNATMPAALLEMGFISNSGDAALLAEHPELFAKGIYDGILDYFDIQPPVPDET